MKCDGFLSFLRENGDNLKIHIVKPVMQKPLKHGNWLAEEIIDKPMLFSVGSSVIEDFIGQEPCNECKARTLVRCDPRSLFDHGTALGGIYGIAILNDSSHFSPEIDRSTIGTLVYSSSKSSQLDTPTENGKVHQVRYSMYYTS